MNKNDNKNGKEFFELLSDLDEDIVEGAWEEKGGMITTIDRRGPMNIVREIAAAAAAVCVLTVGIFAVMKFHTTQSAEPNESNKTSSEIISSNNSVSLTESVVVNNPEPTKESGFFSFSIEGRDDLYYGISGEIYNSDWENPAVVKITYGSLSPTRRVYLCVTGDANWPEDHIMTDVVMVDSITGCKLTYNDDYGETLPVYLLAMTGDDGVGFEGYWVP